MAPLPSLGYEQYDGRLRRLTLSPLVALTSVDGLRPVSVDLARLPRLGVSRTVSCTNPCTGTVAALVDLGVVRPEFPRSGHVFVIAVLALRLSDG